MFSRILHGVVMALFILTILAFVGLGVYEIVHGTSFALWGIALGNRVLRGVLIMVVGVIISFALWSLVGTVAEIGLETRKTRKLLQELVDMNMNAQVSRYSMGLADAVPMQNKTAPQNAGPSQNRPPVQNPAPVQNRPPVQNPAPVQNRPPVQNPAPMQNRPPMQNTAPMQNPAPMQDRPPVQNMVPMQEPGLIQNRPPVQNPGPMQNTMPAQDPAPMQSIGVTQNLTAEESGLPAGNDMKGTEGAAVQNEISVPDTDGQQKI